MSEIDSTPIQFELIREKTAEAQFSADYLVLYGLQGSADILTGDLQYELKTAGLLTIPPFSYYELRIRENCAFAVLHITQKFLRVADPDNRLANVLCYCRDSDPGYQKEYDLIRMRFAMLFEVYFQSSRRSEMRIFSMVSELLSDLTTHFSCSEPAARQKIDSTVRDRCVRIINYIHANWQEDISIAQLAEQEYVSVGYLTRFFKKYFGKTFSEYLTDLRLQNAVRDLEAGRANVTETALSNGFRNTNSFIQSFKNCYGCTPNQYRKEHEKKLLPDMQFQEHALVPEDNGISALLKYAELENRREGTSETAVAAAENRQVSVSAAAKGRKLRHTWKKLLNIGYARNALLAEVQEQIRLAQTEIGFEYARFHGILDDDMHVYFEDEQHQPYLDFSRVDLLLDFLIRQGLKPYVELGYMPGQLAKKKVKIFDRPSYISTYRDEENWKILIRELLQHMVERYGRDQVKEWKFTTQGCNCVASGIIPLDDYLRLYQVTYSCVKETDPMLSFGGPGGWASSLRDSTVISSFLAFAAENGCTPDFICTQCYPHHSIKADDAFWQLTLSQTQAPSVLSSDVHYLRNALKEYRERLKKSGLSHLRVWIEEWNSTIWQRDLSGDTCYKAAWLTNNICENYDEAEAFGYWTLSDFLEESSNFGTVYHGGFGLFTYNGIPKSGWQAMLLLRMLGEQKLAAGKGWMVTKGSSGYQIILSHYCHYDNLYCMRYRRLTDPRKVYSVFEETAALKYYIQLRDIPEGTYEIRQYSISPENGSSFDAWMDLGMPKYLRNEEITYLKRVSQPRYQVVTEELKEIYSAECLLEPHEVHIIMLRKI